jgi:hypothetical protein
MQDLSNTIVYVAWYELSEDISDDTKCILKKTFIVSRDLRMMKIGQSCSYSCFLEKIRKYQHHTACYVIHFIAFKVEGDVAEHVETALLAKSRPGYHQGEWTNKCVSLYLISN